MDATSKSTYLDAVRAFMDDARPETSAEGPPDLAERLLCSLRLRRERLQRLIRLLDEEARREDRKLRQQELHSGWRYRCRGSRRGHGSAA